MDSRSEAIEFIIKEIRKDGKALESVKLAAARKFKLAKMIRNSEIIASLRPNERKLLVPLLRKRPMRTASGVTPVAVMIKPDGSCPYSCIYCPTGLGAKSYTGFEPAALRARQEDFDPLRQVRNRLRHYEECGHPTDKCEMILMGGTFLRMPARYKRSFVKGIYDGLNGSESKTLRDAIKRNEIARHRAVGLTIETRPDVCGKKEIDEMLNFGATRVELGVQHPDDRIYRTLNRGHKTQDVITATSLLKDSAFKVLYHIMPGLPGSDKKKDIAMVKRLFSDERFRPDMLKIYPALVMPGTGLERLMKSKGYHPYTTSKAADVISEFFRYIPDYVRVMRVQRDIPTNLIGSGVVNSNLRQMVDEQIEKKGIRPLEIRYREIGPKISQGVSTDFIMKRKTYRASRGNEIFLSFENRSGHLAGFLRLRIPYRPYRKEIDQRTALVRELHVYGMETEIGKTGNVQHAGLGTKLLEEAKKIANEEFDMRKVLVISGIGVREYYRKLGYKLIGNYMAKAF